jgi:hypothetical protein
MAQPEDRTKKAVSAAVKEIWPDAFELMVVPTGFSKNGIPDHIWCVPITITQELVGRKIGAFIGVESKGPGGQLKGIQAVRLSEIMEAGGFSAVAWSPEDAYKIQQQLKDWFCLK